MQDKIEAADPVLAEEFSQPLAEVPEEVRRANIRAARGIVKHSRSSVEDFLRQKHEETEREYGEA